MKLTANLKSKLDSLPNKPGVYLMRDRLGRVIYVGKAKSLSKRVRSYFQPGRFNHHDPKTQALVSMITDISFHQVKNETESILLEGKLIKEYKPKYNISFRDDKRFPLVKVTNDPFPRFILSRLKKPDGCRYFGPFIHSGAVRNTMKYLRRHFHVITDSPQGVEIDKGESTGEVLEYTPPMRVHRLTREEYATWVEKACVFLEGKDEDVLMKMEEDMLKAAGKRDFERAASLRDTLHDLRVTVKQSARKFAREMPRRSGEDTGLVALAEVLKLEKPPEVIEAFDISHIYGQHTVGSMVHFAKGRPVKANYRHFNIRGVPLSDGEVVDPASRIDDFASIREIVGRRYRRLKEEGRTLPDLVLIDGGRGQLSSALLALNEVGVELVVIGLAKENEEIYLPDQSRPLRLERSSPALQLLQRIRDESHRFANTPHEGWRRKQIRESMLDEIPGIGAARKKALLNKFGSLERLRKADLEEIAGVEGFGRKKAEILYRALHPK